MWVQCLSCVIVIQTERERERLTAWPFDVHGSQLSNNNFNSQQKNFTASAPANAKQLTQSPIFNICSKFPYSEC